MRARAFLKMASPICLKLSIMVNNIKVLVNIPSPARSYEDVLKEEIQKLRIENPNLSYEEAYNIASRNLYMESLID
jgi:hypothetical protein